MAGSKTAYLEVALQQMMLGNVAYTVPGTYHVALSTAAFDTSAIGTSMTEVTGGGYARVSITNDLTTFPAPSGSNPSVLSNGVAINFPTATGSWGTVLSAYLTDASSGGNCLYGADLAAGVTIGSGSSFLIPIGAMVFQEL